MTPPLIQLHRVGGDTVRATLWAKCEFYSQPSGSNKDRIARRLLRANPVQPGTVATFVVPTSGNLGISVAAQAIPQGHKVIVVVPEKTTADKIEVLKSLGADIYRTSTRAHLESDESYVGLARKLAEKIPNAILLDEFSSALNPETHYLETAEEILDGMPVDRKIDMVIVPAESGGMLVGIARKLKEKLPSVHIVGVDARGSILANPDAVVDMSQYRMEAIGNSFVPQVIAQAPSHLIDRWTVVTDKEVFPATRRLIQEEGLLVGMSSGAALAAALKEAAQLPADKNVVLVFPDSARNYSSTLLNETWLRQQGLLVQGNGGVDRYRGATVAQLNLPEPTTIIATSTTLGYAITSMEREGFGQLPVLFENKFVGYVALASLRGIVRGDASKDIQTVDRWMHIFNRHETIPTIRPELPLFELHQFFDRHPVAFVTDSEAKRCLGVVTKIDLVAYLSRIGGP